MTGSPGLRAGGAGREGQGWPVGGAEGGMGRGPVGAGPDGGGPESSSLRLRPGRSRGPAAGRDRPCSRR